MVTEKNATLEQLRLLKDMTRRTGLLHEAQVHQLKIWPRVVFSTSTAASSEIDVKKKHLTFKVVTPKPPDALECPEGEVLASWVRELLGDDWQVTVNFTAGKNTKKSYSYSKPEKTNVKP